MPFYFSNLTRAFADLAQLDDAWRSIPIADWGRQRFGGADVPGEKRLADLGNLLDLVKLDSGANAALLAPLLDIPLPPERALALPPEEWRRRQKRGATPASVIPKRL